MQTLCNTLTVTDLQPQTSITVPHTLYADSIGALIPDVVSAERSTAITVQSATAASVTFFNEGWQPETCKFFVMRFHSMQGQCIPQHLSQGRPFAGSLWTGLAPVTVGNSDVEASLFSPTSTGTLTLPPNYWVPGRKLRVETRGSLSALNGQQTNFKVVLGAYTLIDVTGTLPNGLANAYIESLFDLVCYEGGANARIRGTGRTFIGPAVGAVGATAVRPLNMAADQVLDAALAATIDHRYRWLTKDPGNTLTLIAQDVRTLN
jgi:hypothetical protein